MNARAITGHFENPADAAALAEIEAAEAAGLDPFGDDDDTSAAAPAAAATAPAADNNGNDGDDDLDTDGAATQTNAGEPAEGAQEQQAAQGADTVAADDKAPAVSADQLDAILGDEPAKPIKFKADTPEGYETKIAELDAKEAKAFKEMMEGSLEADEYLKIKAEVSRETRKLERELARAETLVEVNTQTEATQQAQALANTKALAKKAGLDYDADPKAVKQFDATLSALAADPDNANKTAAELYTEANEVVMTLRGITKPAANAQGGQAAQPQGKPEPRKATDVPPVTLRDLPAASMPNTGGGVAEHLSRLEGVDYEAAFDRLTPAQQAALLDT